MNLDLAWYELALFYIGLFMVGGVFGWIVVCLVGLRKENVQA